MATKWGVCNRDVSISFEKEEDQASYPFSCRILTIQINVLMTTTCGTWPWFLTLLHASYVTLGKSQFLHLQKGRSGGDGFGGYKHSIRDRGWANSTLPHKSRRRKKHLLTVVNVTQLWKLCEISYINYITLVTVLFVLWQYKNCGSPKLEGKSLLC